VIRRLALAAAGGVVGGLACAVTFLVFGIAAAEAEDAGKTDERQLGDDLGNPADVIAARRNVTRGGWDR
jgi:hypothetical protein